ncbi:MAG: hypothetical protein RL235_1157 [Chlamydiota bacterium]|jgi:hypothetical protein
MADTNPIDPNTPQSPIAKPSASGKEPKAFTYHGGQVAAKSMTFLGMHFDSKEAQKLWNVLIQNLNREIQKDQAKSVKALKKMRPGHEQD